MSPKLIAVGGPLTGQEFPLEVADCTLGRDADNTICLPSKVVSRQHCRIQRTPQGSLLQDLQSHNGVRINGEPYREHLLRPGDRISIGDFVFVYSEGDDDTAGSAFEPATVELTREQILQPEAVDRAAQALLSAATLFTALKSMRQPQSGTGQRMLERLLLNLIFELVPAEHGMVLLGEQGSEEPVYATARDRAGHMPATPQEPVTASRQIVRRVLQEQVAVMLNEDRDTNELETLICTGTRSVIAVPLLAPDLSEAGVAQSNRPLGLLYLSTTNPSRRFNEEHLQLVAAIGVLASTAMENRRLLDWLRQENERLSAEVTVAHGMVGESAPLKELLQRIVRVATTDSTVLVMGESGTGKELVARAIHQNSRRVARPFVAVNCAALADTLLESELFGHEKGAFTGAVVQKRGKLEMAEGGTVFLDEVGEIAPLLQAKLLRVLQEREFERVGGTRTLKLDIRVLAATNRDLAAEVRAGRFREDLYYRLNVVTLRTIPLRERKEDILVLARHFLSLFKERMGRKLTGISPRAQRLLLNYDWPGNVRELQNAIERAVVMGPGDLIQPEDLPESILDTGSQPAAAEGLLPAAIYEAKRKVVGEALQQSGGNFTKAAQLLGVHVNYLHRLVNQLDLRPGATTARGRHK